MDVGVDTVGRLVGDEPTQRMRMYMDLGTAYALHMERPDCIYLVVSARIKGFTEPLCV